MRSVEASKKRSDDLFGDKPMLIAVHDVMPQWEKEILRLFDALAPFEELPTITAVVPGSFQGREDSVLIKEMRARNFEIALHGYNHRGNNAFHPVSYLTGWANEMSGRSLADALSRIRLGQHIMAEIFGRCPSIFVPPAWSMGPLTLGALQPFRLTYVLGMSSLRHTTGYCVPLATWSWDCGQFRSSGWLGELSGIFHSLLPHRIPCVVLHPRDIERGFLPRAQHKIRQLLEQGYQPLLVQNALESAVDSSHKE